MMPVKKTTPKQPSKIRTENDVLPNVLSRLIALESAQGALCMRVDNSIIDFLRATRKVRDDMGLLIPEVKKHRKALESVLQRLDKLEDTKATKKKDTSQSARQADEN
jgi:hypothetical protein